MVQEMNFSDTPFAVSATRNVLIGVGLEAEAELNWFLANDPRASFTCSVQGGMLTWRHARDGSCTGWGCCEHPLPILDDEPSSAYKFFTLLSNPTDDIWLWKTYPCTYGMLVEKSWYNFSTTDMYDNKTLLQRFPRGVSLALDFAAGNTWCPAEGQPLPPDYACVSGNSSCANATYTPGYICKCWDHYAGNPYIANGCQDIDECKLPEVYPCSSGICKNTLGGYDCPCKYGMKGDGKGGTCTDVFSPEAKAAVGVIGGILLMVILWFTVIHRKEKKKTKEFYKKNGGPVLEKAKGIKIFKKGELKPILKNNNIIGKGGFGEVYKGLLDNKEVAIKKPINGSVRENEQFANESSSNLKSSTRTLLGSLVVALKLKPPCWSTSLSPKVASMTFFITRITRRLSTWMHV
uniref:Wall-associated receptor kinase 2 n=1 Tax=Triticum urartu TaxID=4572 RepID=A0A8R7UZW1_TRIUA